MRPKAARAIQPSSNRSNTSSIGLPQPDCRRGSRRLPTVVQVEKQLLKRLAGRYVPAAVTDRRKFAFVAPGSPALLDRGPAWVSELLSYDYIKKRGYFNPEAVERLKKQYAQPGFAINQTFNNDLLMIVLTFSVFLEIFKMPDYA